MNKMVMAVIGGVVVLGVVGVVFMQSKPQAPNPKPQDEAVAEPTGVMMEEIKATGETKEFVVEGSDFKFAPTELRVKAGDTVVITFKNMKGFHDFVIDEFEVKTSQIGPEDEEEVEFVANKTGTFEYYCSVGQHRKMGMVGKLIVE